MSDFVYTLEELKENIRRLSNQLEYGCGYRECVIRPSNGTGTNRSCKCDPQSIALEIYYIHEAVRINGKWPLMESQP